MTPGRHVGKIEENDIKSAGTGTEYVFLRVLVEGASMPIQIWLTEKAMGMARAQLAACGFTIGKDKLLALSEDRTFLAGRDVPVEIYEEEYKGRLQTKARIVTGDVSKKRISQIEKMLTNAAAEELDDIPF